LKVSVNGYGVKFYFWCNLWYTALDLVKLFIDEIQIEYYINRIPTQSVHPKLKLTSSMYHKKNKQHNYNNKKEYPDLEMRSFTRSITSLKESLIEEVDKVNNSQIKSNLFVDAKMENDYQVYLEESKSTNNEISEEINKDQINKIYDIIDSLNNDTDLNVF